MNEDEAARVFSRAAESIPPMSNLQPDMLIRGGQRIRRRGRVLSAAGVAAAAALIIGAGAIWLPGTTGSKPAQTASLPTSPAGTRWVGFNGVMVAVPDDWSVNDTGCTVITPSDRVVLGSPRPRNCAESPAEPVSTITMEALSTSLSHEMSGVEGHRMDLAGVPAYRVGEGCDFSADCGGVLVVPNLDVAVQVSTSDHDMVETVLDSARLMPEGYTSVPNVAGLVDDADVEAALSRAELAWTSRCQAAMGECEMAPLVATDPGAGSVVPVGATVSATDPSRSDPEQPSELPAAPPGTRWAGFQGVMVAMPASWDINDTRCGQPLSDTVDFDDRGASDPCRVPGSERHSVLRLVRLSSPLGQQWQGVEGRGIDVDGLKATRVGDGCRLSDPPQCSGLVAIATLDVVVVVESRTSSEEVDAILDSARLVPQGYTAVPDVRYGDPAQLLQGAGLSLESPQPDFPHYVTGTLPVAGLVVPLGTDVSLVIAEG